MSSCKAKAAARLPSEIIRRAILLRKEVLQEATIAVRKYLQETETHRSNEKDNSHHTDSTAMTQTRADPDGCLPPSRTSS